MQHANSTVNVFNLIFQIPTSVVTAGGIPTSAIGRSVANFSGHILKLVPGDFNYAFPLFPIVIIWNGETKFTPTQFTKANAICNWKLGIIDRHLSEAINLFEEVEGDLKNPTLNQSFNYLRCQVVETKQILGDRVRGISHMIPPVSYSPRSGTTSDLTNFQRGMYPHRLLGMTLIQVLGTLNLSHLNRHSSLLLHLNQKQLLKHHLLQVDCS